MGVYYKHLAKTAEIGAMTPIITNIHKDCFMNFVDDFVNYGIYNYRSTKSLMTILSDVKYLMSRHNVMFKFKRVD